MSVLLLDGRALAARRLPALRARAEAVRERRGTAPRLGILAFADASGIAPHVAGKRRAAAEAGVAVRVEMVPHAATRSDALARATALATDDSLDAMFVQFPYPDPAWGPEIEAAIPAEIDVDVMSPAAVRRFRDDPAAPPPVTVSAALELLDAHGVTVAGRYGVVVATPSEFAEQFRLAFARRGARVGTLVAPAVAASDQRLRGASLVIVAAGQPGLVHAESLAPGAVAIDVGYFNAGGRGDIALDGGVAHLDALAPVPGSIGPMTVSCLLERTIRFAEGRA